MQLTFRVSYLWDTGRFPIEALGTTTFLDPIRIPLNVAGSALSVASGWAALGWDANYVHRERMDFPGGIDRTSKNPLVAGDPRYRERYYCCYKTLAYHDTGQLLWGTGANAANNCAQEFGWDKTDVTMGVSSFGLYSLYPREMRETIAIASQDRYGPKLPGTLLADWVYDENSAIMLRNGLFDFTCVPLVQVRFVTHVCPDLQRMRVIGFRSSVDELRPYPLFGSDGSWAGKGARVLEIEQEIDQTYHVQVLALVA